MPRFRFILKRLGLATVVVLVGLQCFRPTLDNVGHPDGPDSFVAQLKPPVTVRRYLEDSCYDCHSNSTHYPWYAHVQPFGWVITRHVREGKRSLNLSTFGTLGPKAQEQRLEYIADAITEGEMPYWPYRLLNLHANPTDRQLTAINAWLGKTLTAHAQAPAAADATDR